VTSGAGDERLAAAGAAEAEFLRTWGPLPPFKVCPIGWQPSALAPVFYGYRDYTSQPVSELAVRPGVPGGGLAGLAPVNMRVFFPSLDGSPQYASMLAGCGRYPLIVFAHGDCPGDDDNYLRWYELPAQLARAGYVVAVPQIRSIGTHPSVNTAARAELVSVMDWIRADWEYADSVLPAPATGLAGHSYGAMNADILATEVDVGAVAMLSAPWTDWSSPPWPFTQVVAPQLFTWGTGFGDIYAVVPDNLWEETGLPRHRVVFTGADHWDYLYSQSIPCRGEEGGRGPCPWEGAVAADYLTMFFGRYLPPEYWPNLPDEIPPTLEPPPLVLTQAQQFYAGSYLQGGQAFGGDTSCAMTVTQALPANRTVPYVLNLPASTAASRVGQRGFVPVFSGNPDRTGAWVRTQDPPPGAVANPGTDVRLGLATGIEP
jgi:hypothetical protein